MLKKILFVSIYTKFNEDDSDNENVIQYLKVISQDFDYLHNEHNDESYRKPSFWKQFHNIIANEQSMGINSKRQKCRKNAENAENAEFYLNC